MARLRHHLVRHFRISSACSCRWIDETEHIVVNVVAALVVWQQLEGLDVAHRSLFRLDLGKNVSTHSTVLISRRSTHQQCAAHNDEDAAVSVARLGVDRGDLVLDLLEGKRLRRASVSQLYRAPMYDYCLTLSFSMMDDTPRTGAASNVSIDSSRCRYPSAFLLSQPRAHSSLAYVKGRQLVSVGVECVVVVLHELLCRRVRWLSWIYVGSSVLLAMFSKSVVLEY